MKKLGPCETRTRGPAGIRGAPRDALVADIAPAHLRGASFGLRQSLDTIGALIGPLLVIALMWLTANQFKTVFWIAVVPAFLSLALIVFAVHEPERAPTLRQVKFPLHRDELARLGCGYWLVVAVATVFTLVRFSEAFLLLRASQAGLRVMLVPAVLVIMNIVYSLASYPAGVLADDGGRYRVLIVGVTLPRPVSDRAPSTLAPAARSLSIPGPEGLTLGAWYCDRGAHTPLVILLHGYGAEKSVLSG